jgi:hypothetical protein
VQSANIGWIRIGLHVAMPEGAGPADQGRIPAETDLDVIQQGADRTNIEDAWSREVAPEDLREEGKNGRLRFAPSGWSF